MKIEFSIPDELAQQIAADGADLRRIALEALALEGYRSRRLSEYQLQQVLGMSSRFQVHSFLKEHDVPLNYSLHDLMHDIESSRKFETAGLEGNSNAA